MAAANAAAAVALAAAAAAADRKKEMDGKGGDTAEGLESTSKKSGGVVPGKPPNIDDLAKRFAALKR